MPSKKWQKWVASNLEALYTWITASNLKATESVMTDESYVTTTLRMPLSMSKEIKHRAIDNHRSVNSELLFRLQQTLDREKVQSKGSEV